MVANIITLCRLLLTFLVVILFRLHRILDIALIFTITGIFILDALDGYIARKRHETSQLGEILDTVSDRIIENTFWIYFAVVGDIPLWMPLVVMARGFITDASQHLSGYPQSGWRSALTRSRISRALSGMTKMLAFTGLASVPVFNNDTLETVSFILATFAVGFCLLRGLPFFFISKPLCQPNTSKTSRSSAM